ncbi:MAG TPA: hypothetical protein VFF06_22585 [Polyangia bacterium]|nr:hypothetical protein [Polyangia bacterium]
MRFCPFCAQENPDDSRECGHCGKRLPAPRVAPARTPSPPPLKAQADRVVAPKPAPRSRPLTPTAPPPNVPPTPPPGAPASSAPSMQRADGVPVAEIKKGASEPTRPAVASKVQPQAPSPAPPPQPQSLKSKPDAQTLTPEMPRGKSGTLLGLPKLDEVTKDNASPPVSPSSAGDSDRRTTKPLAVQTAAAAVGMKVSPTGPTVPNPTGPRKAVAPQISAGDDGNTEPQPKIDHNEFGGGDTRDDDVDMRGAMAHPILDPQSATPAIPTMALPAMPPRPEPATIIASVRYLVPVARAVWARRQAQKSIRELLHGDQRLLDQVLRDLGRAAREENLVVPAIAEEMKRVRTEEERRAAADQAILDADAALERERERWKGEESERQAEIAQRDSELRTSEQELKLKGDERRVHDAERARLENEIRAAEKRAAAADAKAAKADVTPPEKGGGPNTAANARAEAEAAKREAASLAPARDHAAAKVAELDGPVDALAKAIAEHRSELAARRKELAEAQASNRKTISEQEAAKKAASNEREAAEREMSQRFVAAGTLLNLNRVDGPRFTPLYARIDELKGGVNAREAAIVRLESERRSYDKDAVQKGLITVGVIVAALAIIGIVLAVLLSR